MTYDPFERGPFPVGVQTDTWTDSERQRTLPVEIWYPADAGHAGQDLDAATWDTFTPGWVAEGGATAEDQVHQAAVRDAAWSEDEATERPLVLLVHGWAGFRREATFIGTHLASHGYVVVSPDVVGSTFVDVDAFLATQQPVGTADALGDHLQGIATNRRGDIPFLISTATTKLPVRASGVGVTGASFGGWSALVAPAMDERVQAVVPMCPANGDAPTFDGDGDAFADAKDGSWLTDAPTLLLVGDRDSLLPLYGQLTVLRSVPASTKQMVVLARADHNHFVDDIDTGQAWLKDYAEGMAALYPDGPGDWTRIARSVEPMERLVPGDQAQLAWRGLTTAHFDAYLRGNHEAQLLLRDPDAALSAHDIESNTVGRRG
jgi:dienelactone hydrolase